MQLSSLPISGYSCIISAPTETLAWLWKSQAASLIVTCYARASTKAKKKKIIYIYIYIYIYENKFHFLLWPFIQKILFPLNAKFYLILVGRYLKILKNLKKNFLKIFCLSKIFNKFCGHLSIYLSMCIYVCIYVSMASREYSTSIPILVHREHFSGIFLWSELIKTSNSPLFFSKKITFYWGFTFSP